MCGVGEAATISQEEGGREGAIVFILMRRAKEGAVTLGNYSLTTTHSTKTTERAKENIVEVRAFVQMILHSPSLVKRPRMFTRARYFIPTKWANTREIL